MAENENGEERTEPASEKRLREARERGQVPRSKELATAAIFAAAAIALLTLGGGVARGAMQWMRNALTLDPSLLDGSRSLPAHAGMQLLGLTVVVAPLLLICLAAGFIAPIAMSGLRWSNKALAPDFKRLNPMSGLKRMYGQEGLVELLKSLLRVGLICMAAMLCLSIGLQRLLGLLQLPLESAASEGLSMAGWTLLTMAGALTLLAAVDVPYQLWNHHKQLRMTRQELREEMKESEGRPEVKSRIRQIQQQMSQRRMMEAVPTADVILVNPTHYAVALSYDPKRMRSPKVVAKGVDEIALTIREVAQRHHVAIVSAPPLARALYRDVDIGREIPVKLYAAVAQILSYVFQLRSWRNGAGPEPTLPVLPDLPDAPEPTAP